MEIAKLELTPASGNTSKEDVLRIDDHRKKVNGEITIFRFIDKDTKQLVLYAPSLNVSSYGETHEDAFEMIKESLTDLFSHFANLPIKELKTELINLEWKEAFINFFKVVVNSDINVEDLNAFDRKIEIEKYILAA